MKFWEYNISRDTIGYMFLDTSNLETYNRWVPINNNLVIHLKPNTIEWLIASSES